MIHAIILMINTLVDMRKEGVLEQHPFFWVALWTLNRRKFYRIAIERLNHVRRPNSLHTYVSLTGKGTPSHDDWWMYGKYIEGGVVNSIKSLYSRLDEVLLYSVRSDDGSILQMYVEFDSGRGETLPLVELELYKEAGVAPAVYLETLGDARHIS